MYQFSKIVVIDFALGSLISPAIDSWHELPPIEWTQSKIRQLLIIPEISVH